MKNRYLFDQVESVDLVFFIGKLQKGLNSCRNGEVLRENCETGVRVAMNGLCDEIIAT